MTAGAGRRAAERPRRRRRRRHALCVRRSVRTGVSQPDLSGRVSTRGAGGSGAGRSVSGAVWELAAGDVKPVVRVVN